MRSASTSRDQPSQVEGSAFVLWRLLNVAEIPSGNGAIVRWWELRRIPYNFIVGLVGLVSIAALEYLGDALLPRGEDAVEPLMLLFGTAAYGIACNAAYTLGWISEIYLFSHARDAGVTFRKRAFLAGTLLSCAIPVSLFLLCAITWKLGMRAG
jgi:hypothetical protein